MSAVIGEDRSGLEAALAEATGQWEAPPIAGAGPARAPRGWYAGLAAGVFPAFVVGFVASALANRLVFVGWGAVAGLGYALLLRAVWEHGPTARATAALSWGALALAALGSLVGRHGESLDLGYRALLWPVYAAALTRPSTFQLAALALALGGGLVLLRARRARRRGQRPGVAG